MPTVADATSYLPSCHLFYLTAKNLTTYPQAMDCDGIRPVMTTVFTFAEIVARLGQVQVKGMQKKD